MNKKFNIKLSIGISTFTYVTTYFDDILGFGWLNMINQFNISPFSYNKLKVDEVISTKNLLIENDIKHLYKFIITKI